MGFFSKKITTLAMLAILLTSCGSGGSSGGTNNTPPTLPSTNTWAKTYGSGGQDNPRSIQKTSDGGFIVAGETQSFGVGSSDVWVIKLDTSGIIQWQKTYGVTATDYVSSMQQTTDNGFILAVTSGTFSSNMEDLWVLKLDSSGVIQWIKSYGGTSNDFASSIQQTTDGGFIVVGDTNSFGAGNTDIWVLKLNSSGGIQWQKTFGGTSYDSARSVLQTNDGGFIVAGVTASFGVGSFDILVFKLNSSGTVQWQKTYGGTNSEWPSSLLQTADGGFIVAASTSSFGAGNTDIWILKLDSIYNTPQNSDKGNWCMIACHNP